MRDERKQVSYRVAGRWLCRLLLVSFFLSGAGAAIRVTAQDKNGGGGETGARVLDASPAASKNPRPAGALAYLIGVGDVLRVDVWREPEISHEIVVRPDGKITVSLIGDVTADNLTTDQLAEVITDRLQEFLKDPRVTVMVVEVHSKYFYLVGEIARPGAYPLLQPTTVLQALSFAGSFREFAKTKKILVLRNHNGEVMRSRFNYDEAVKGRNPEQNIVLKHGDTIVVP